MTDDQPPETDQLETEDQEQDTSPNAEAAKYRRRLRDTETERDALAEQVTNLRRAAVDRQVETQGITPDGFWASGVQLEDLLDDEGGIDDEKITTHVKEATDKLGLTRFPAPVVPKEGTKTTPNNRTGWESAFTPR